MRTARYRLWILIFAAWYLRVGLVVRGGQLFFPDEVRFMRGAQFNLLLARGQLGQALDMLTTTEHSGFTLVSSIPALVQELVNHLEPVMHFEP